MTFKGKIEEIVGDMDQQKCVLENGKTLEQAVRKEYRMLTKEERRALASAQSIKVKAVNALFFAASDIPLYQHG
jgi:hypothetical protein